jgi:CRISPR-associated DxTHG motif protein
MPTLPAVHIVGFVGDSSYDHVRYELDGSTSCLTRIVSAALCDLARGRGHEVGGVTLLVTEAARTRYACHLGGDDAIFRRHAGRGPELRGLPAERDARWTSGVFCTIHDVLDGVARVSATEALSGEREPAPATEIWIDITHGFRALPFIGAAAIAYTLSDWARRELASPPQIRIFYGALDRARAEEPQAIWELSDLVTAARWNSALDALMRFGRADDLAALGAAEADLARRGAQARGVSGADLQIYAAPKQLGAAARRFADDLTLIRLKDLIQTSSAALARRLEEADPGLRALLDRRPYLAAPLAALRSLASELQAPNVLGAEGLRATARLALRYGKLQQLAAQFVALREGAVTAYARRTGAAAREPGEPGCTADRERVTQLLREHRGPAARLPGPASDEHRGASDPVVRLSEDIGQFRNDVEHGGIRDQPNPPRTLREKASDLTSRLAKIVEDLA